MCLQGTLHNMDHQWSFLLFYKVQVFIFVSTIQWDAKVLHILQ